MEDGLVLGYINDDARAEAVLILVVMEDGLVLTNELVMPLRQFSLNPCCNGRWSRTCLWSQVCSSW